MTSIQPLLCLIFFFIFNCTLSVLSYSKLNPYHDLSEIIPNTFHKPYANSISTFENPALIQEAKHNNLKLDYTKFNFDQNVYRASFIMIRPKKIIIGAHLKRFSLEDIYQVQRSSITNRGVITSSFAYQKYTASVIGSIPISKKINVGLKSTLLYENILKNSSQSYYMDIGISCKISSTINLGFYSNHLFFLKKKWSTGHKENLKREFIPHITLSYPYLFIHLKKWNRYWIASFELPIFEEFSLLYHIVRENEKKIHSSIGLRLLLKSFSLEYNLLQFHDTIFNSNQHMLGIRIVI